MQHYHIIILLCVITLYFQIVVLNKQSGWRKLVGYFGATVLIADIFRSVYILTQN
jgi:hypothetical protein